MEAPWEEPELEMIPWPDMLTPDEDGEKEYSGLLEDESMWQIFSAELAVPLAAVFIAGVILGGLMALLIFRL